MKAIRKLAKMGTVAGATYGALVYGAPVVLIVGGIAFGAVTFGD
jgi:hypothetical protein